jgi:hypothetical protein
LLKSRSISVCVLLIIAALGINEFVRPAPFKFQPYLPGVVETRPWLQMNCRGEGRDIDKCKATIAALEGSSADALKLASGIAPDDLSGRHYWLHIAAQNGSGEGMRRLAKALADLPAAQYGRVHRIRARFWMERAARAGDLDAKNLLSQIPPVSEAEVAAHTIPKAANPNLELVCGPMPWWRIFAALWGDWDDRLSTNAGANLPCEVVAELELKALSGERTSRVHKILRLLRLVQGRNRLTNGFEHFYWMAIAAENEEWGSAEVMASFSYADSHLRPGANLRERFWFQKAIEGGDNKYANYLSKLQQEDLTSEWLNEEQ